MEDVPGMAWNVNHVESRSKYGSSINAVARTGGHFGNGYCDRCTNSHDPNRMRTLGGDGTFVPAWRCNVLPRDPVRLT